MPSYTYAGKIEAASLQEFSRMALELNPGVRLSSINQHRMLEGSSVPLAYQLIRQLAMDRRKPYWMLQGFLSHPGEPHPGEPVCVGGFLNEDGEPVRVMSTRGDIDRSLLSIMDSQLDEQDRISELAAIVEDLGRDYAHRLDAQMPFDTLYQSPTGALFGQTIREGKIIVGPVHLAAFSRRADGAYKTEIVNQQV